MKLNVLLTTRAEMAEWCLTDVARILGGKNELAIECAAPGVWRVVVCGLGEEIWDLIGELEGWGYQPYAMPDDVKQSIRLKQPNELTTYQKKVAGRLRAEGVGEDVIAKILKEI